MRHNGQLRERGRTGAFRAREPDLRKTGKMVARRFTEFCGIDGCQGSRVKGDFLCAPCITLYRPTCACGCGKRLRTDTQLDCGWLLEHIPREDYREIRWPKSFRKPCASEDEQG